MPYVEPLKVQKAVQVMGYTLKIESGAGLDFAYSHPNAEITPVLLKPVEHIPHSYDDTLPVVGLVITDVLEVPHAFEGSAGTFTSTITSADSVPLSYTTGILPVTLVLTDDAGP